MQEKQQRVTFFLCMLWLASRPQSWVFTVAGGRRDKVTRNSLMKRDWEDDPLQDSRWTRVYLGFAKSRPTARRPKARSWFSTVFCPAVNLHMHRSASGLGVQHGRRWVWIRLPFNHLNRLTMHFLPIEFCQQTNKQNDNVFHPITSNDY